MIFIRRKIIIPEKPGWNPDLIDKRDYRHEELLGALPSIAWQEIDPHPEPMFPIKNQDGSSSCVKQAVAKALGILEYNESGVYRDLSAGFYALRSNPGPGMYMREGVEFAIKIGCPLEAILPSQNLNEQQMNALKDQIITDVKQVALVYKAKSYLYCDMTFDNIAGILSQKIPFLIGVAGTNEGWRNTKGWVRPPRPGERLWYHAMVISPENKKGKNYGIINGKKALIVDNSWGENHSATFKGQNFLTEEYLPYMKWNFYPFGLPDDWRDKEPHEIEKPKHQFNRDLFYGLKNDSEVVWLQKCLKYYGTFPKSVPETGNYYWITVEAVQGFQLAEEIVKPFQAGYGRTGPLTRTQLNKIFS